MRIPFLIWILQLVSLTEGLDDTKVLRYRRKCWSVTRRFHLSHAPGRRGSCEVCIISPRVSSGR